ncbi:6-carboxytetrahydropterin synthase [Rhodococcus sp. NPDC060176]|uniref:6-carboxytetrahydropterin synthase n=1 Tax=unclassified Rhodococcus (in: high G+C Gram-positive bacteria) TaxID=192944 RepID=UPI003658F04F
MFSVEIRRTFAVRQGLPAPVRDAKNLPPLMPAEGFRVTMRAGFSFQDDQLGDRGWFVDTDALDEAIDRCTEQLASGVWPEIFDFRPSFENVTKWAFGELAPSIPQLAYVELDNETIGVATRYVRSQ